jgi:hypothetical protein
MRIPRETLGEYWNDDGTDSALFSSHALSWSYREGQTNTRIKTMDTTSMRR